MKRILTILVTLALSFSAFGQAQITTRKEKLSDFTIRTMKVVLSGNHFVDTALQEALNNTWNLSAFEFCTLTEFNTLKNNEEYYFMVPVKVKYKNETAPGITMLTLVKGKSSAKSINDMVEVVSMPICAADFPSGREAAILPGLVDIIQGYVSKSLSGNFTGLSSYVTPLGKSAGRKVYISEDDIASQAGEAVKSKKDIVITSSEEVDNVFLTGDENALISYVVAPAEPGKGSVCWKMLIDVRTHELFYYKKHNVVNEDNVGFLKSDLKKIAKSR